MQRRPKAGGQFHADLMQINFRPLLHPSEIASNNGSQSVSAELEDFPKNHGVLHKRQVIEVGLLSVCVQFRPQTFHILTKQGLTYGVMLGETSWP